MGGDDSRMNVWDWIEILWLVALSAWAVMTTLAFNNVDRVSEDTRERVCELERQDERTRKHLKGWARDMNR